MNPQTPRITSSAPSTNNSRPQSRSASVAPSATGSSTSSNSKTTKSSSTNGTAGTGLSEQQKLFARDPHKGPRSTDWMLSPETLQARREKDEKFAKMVEMGLAKGRTKAGWAQARRPGKRDRDAAKRLAMGLAPLPAEGEGEDSKQVE